MTKERSRIFWVLLVSMTLIAPFILFSSGLTPWSHTGRLATVGQEFIYPVELGFHRIASGVSRWWSRYFWLSNVETENQFLRGEVARMQSRILDYEEQVKENDRLRRLLGFSSRVERKVLLAEVVGEHSHSAFSSIRIDRGQRAGVQVGMPVIAADGLVGKVMRTGLNFSDVQLVVDSSYHLDVLLQRTRVRGILKGYSQNRCTLKLHRRADVRIGDTIVTSGLIGGYVKGLPVGRVMRISYDADQVTQIITVEPWIDHRRIEEVMVLISEDPQVNKIEETAGTEWLEDAVSDSAKKG